MTQATNRVIPHGNSRHPWDMWMDGQVWQIRHGVHFHCHPENMRVQIHGQARRRGVKAETNVRGDVVTFRAVEASDDSTSSDTRDDRP